MDFAAFARAAERRELPPVLLIHGDAQLVADALAVATSSLFPDASLAMLGREVLDGDEATGADIVRAASTLPLMTATKLVAVRRARSLDPAPVLSEYVGAPNPTTVLLLLSEETLDVHRDAAGRERKRHWLLDAVPRPSVITAPARQEAALREWLRQRAQHEGIQVTEAAARLLVEWVGDDTAALLAETRKAALSGTSPNTVDEKDVAAVVGEHRLAGIFDLSGAVARRETGTALRVLDRLLVQEEPMRLLTQLTTEVRLGWRVKELEESGQSPEQIARALYRPPHVVKGWLSTTAKTPIEVFATRLRRCWEVELRLKSGGEPTAELTALVTELTSEAG